MIPSASIGKLIRRITLINLFCQSLPLRKNHLHYPSARLDYSVINNIQTSKYEIFYP